MIYHSVDNYSCDNATGKLRELQKYVQNKRPSINVLFFFYETFSKRKLQERLFLIFPKKCKTFRICIFCRQN